MKFISGKEMREKESNTIHENNGTSEQRITDSDIELLKKSYTRMVEGKNQRNKEYEESIDNLTKEISKMEQGVGDIREELDIMLEKVKRMFRVYPANLLTDYKEIKEIQKQGYGRVVWKRYALFFTSLANAKVYMVNAYNKNVGFVHLKDTDKYTRHILNLCFLEDYQKKGLGTETLEWVEQEAKKVGIEYLTLHVRVSNQQAYQTYKNFGFIEERREQSYYKDTGEDAWSMLYFIK